MERICLFGSAGFIGSALKYYLLKLGYQVDCPSRELNLEVKKDVAAFFSSRPSFNLVINASGSGSVQGSIVNPQNDWNKNVLIVQNIGEALLSFSTKTTLLNFSSAAVYGNPSSLPIPEDSDCSPLSPYGKHKLEAEIWLNKQRSEHGLNSISLRPFSVYGPGQDKLLIADLFKRIVVNKERHVVLFGNGKESRDFIFIHDLCLAVDLIIKNHHSLKGPINIASGQEVRIETVAKVFSILFNVDITFNGETRVGDPNNWHADISLIATLGFAPNWTIESGIKEILRHY